MPTIGDVLKGKYQAPDVYKSDMPDSAPPADSAPVTNSAPSSPQPWDYNSNVNPQGNTLPAGAVGWKPDGQPYFGPGIGGTMKGYWWTLLGKPFGGNTGDNWKKVQDLGGKINLVQPDTYKLIPEFFERQGAALLGADVQSNVITDKKLQAQYEGDTKEKNDIEKMWAVKVGANPIWKQDMPPDVKARYDELNAQQIEILGSAGTVPFQVDGRNVSLFQPFIRLANVGLGATFDAFNELAIKYEQLGGVAEAARRAADGKTFLPSNTTEEGLKSLEKYNIYVDQKLKDWARGFDIAGRQLNPFFMAWDTFRLITANMPWEQKVGTIQYGFEAGRLLYSQVIKPTVMAEYNRRVAAGQDPYITALALQNPWAEMAGQMIFDPLNVIGMVSKSAEVSRVVKDAERAIQESGLAEEAGKVLSKVGDAPLGEARAYEIGQELDQKLTQVVDNIEKTRLTVNYKNPFSLSASGTRVRETKVVGTVNMMVTSSIMKGGGGADDVADFYTYLVRATDTTDKANRLDGLNGLFRISEKFSLGRYAFSGDVLETGIIIRNLADPEIFKTLGVARANKAEDLISLLRVSNGDLGKQAEILGEVFQQAVEKQAPKFSELKTAAAEVVKGTAGERAKQLAQTYEGINPAAKAVLSIEEGTLGKVKSWVNGWLSKFYFSQPGFVSRNWQNNLVTMLVDQGPVKSYLRDGKYWSIQDIEADLKGYYGGNLPPAASGFSMGAAEAGKKNIVGKINDAVESGFAKRIYWARFRETMDKFLAPGVAIPAREEFAALGMTNEQVDRFVYILKNQAYGNVEQAIVKFSGEHQDGLLDVWKRWNGSVSEQEMKALREVQLNKPIDELTAMTDVTPATIRETIRNAKKGVLNMASGALDTPIADVSGLNKVVDAGFLDADGTNKLNILIDRYENTTDELSKAIAAARNTVQDQALRDEFSVIEDTFSAVKRGNVRRSGDALIQTALNFSDRSKRATVAELRKMWNESILAKSGPPPANLTSQTFREALWPASRDAKAALYENYYAKNLEQIYPLVEKLKNQFPELEQLFKNSDKASAEMNAYRTALYTNQRIYAMPPAQSVRELALRNGIATATIEGDKAAGTDQHILNIVNKFSGQKFSKVDEIPLEIAQKAFDDRLTFGKFKLWLEKRGGQVDALQEWRDNSKLVEEFAKESGAVPLVPPHPQGAPFSPAEAFNAGKDGYIATLNKIENYMLDNYGLKAVDKADNKLIADLKDLMTRRGKDGLTPAERLTEGQAIADKVGTKWRDFALLPYGETTNFDVALSFVLPYEFWYIGGNGGTYRNWLNRMVQDPQIISRYARLKDTMAQVNKDAPEWWKFNVTIPSNFLGLPIEHPLMFNLEANLWPLYGLTGVDFEDPRKRVNWWTSTIDDMGKFGPSIWSPINLAAAVILNSQGQQDAAARFAGRIIPQTATIKAAASYLNLNLELDPLVQMFSGKGLGDLGASDPYERNRIGVQLTAMQQQNLITPEQALETARTQSGPIWEKAKLMATQARAGGQIASFMLGVGFKARTPQDEEVEKFYQDYFRLISLNQEKLISPDKMRQSWDALRQRYPFMDTVLLSRKSGPDRDRAYAYNILSRVAPGQLNELFKIVDVDPATAEKFYANGGDLSYMSESEKSKFLAGMIDIGAIIAVPGYATKTEWNNAKNSYTDMQAQLQKQFGYGITSTLNDYFNMNEKEAAAYKVLHPEIDQALQAQNEMVVNNPLLYKYYGGIKTVESWQYGKMYDELEKKYGKDIQVTADTYNQLKDSLMLKEASAFYKAHPELKSYFAEKAKMVSELKRKVVQFAAILPDTQTELTGNNPENPTQAALQGSLTPQRISPTEWTQRLGDSMMYLIADYYVNGKSLPKNAENALNYRAREFGYSSGAEMLKIIGLSLYGK